MPRKNHTHKYQLRATSSQPVWACSLPDCNHYMPPHLNSLIEGRSSICWECDDKFILDIDAMKEVRPRCFQCRSEVSKVVDIPIMSDTIVAKVSSEEKKKVIENFLKGA